MKITFCNRPVIFIDVEASGLGTASYPIEVGWSNDDEQEPSSFLIRPPTIWSYADFSPAALGVHKIAYDQLIADGIEVAAACDWLQSAWDGAILVTDAPAMDEKWLRRMYAAAGRDYPWRFLDFHVLDAALAATHGCNYKALSAIANAADDKLPLPHRAGKDARRLGQIARAIADPNYRQLALGL